MTTNERLFMCFVGLVVVALAISCAFRFRPPAISAIPVNARIPICVTTTDLTGSAVHQLFDQRLAAALASDFLFSVEPSRSSAKWTQFRVTMWQNPLYLVKASQPHGLSVTGDLELVSYGPAASDPVEVLGAYAFFGLLGAGLGKPDPDTYTASLQFRLACAGRDWSDDVLVRVARRANATEVSRQQQMDALVGDAVSLFLSSLITGLAKRELISIQEYSFVARSEEEANAKINQLRGSMER